MRMGFMIIDLFGDDKLGPFDDLDKATTAASDMALKKAMRTGEHTEIIVADDDFSVLRSVSITFFPGGK